MPRKHLMPLALLATLACTARAEDGWIKRAADARADQSAAADVVAPVQKGQKVTVLERADAWVKIDVNGKVGWVAADTLSSRPVKADTSLAGRGSGAEMSSGAAIKGLQPIAGDYARGQHLRTDGLEEMVSIKKSVTSQMLTDFVKDGNIERPARKAAKPKE